MAETHPDPPWFTDVESGNEAAVDCRQPGRNDTNDKDRSIGRLRRACASSTCRLTLWVLLLAPCDLAFAQNIPANGHASSYGSGWECDEGYREVDGACAAVVVPDNAYPTYTSYGRAWECAYGYRELGGACIAVEVPSNAYLEPAGDGWKCNRGYRNNAGTCVAIKVPANGYLLDTDYGQGWNCERGYRAIDDDCVAIKVPANGYLVDTSYGPGWRCERGYRAVIEACAVVKLPENAHLDYSGNDWDCNRPYQKKRDKCVLP